jgi:hypothetical protein
MLSLLFQAKNKWSLITGTGDDVPAMYEHTAVVMGDAMYLYGGLTGVVDKV